MSNRRWSNLFPEQIWERAPSMKGTEVKSTRSKSK